MTAARVEKIKSRLQQSLQADRIEIIDDSFKHKGHEGAKSGGGHFNVIIIAKAFENKSLVQRHQLVYAALGDMMQSEIHALSIKALSPEEK